MKLDNRKLYKLLTEKGVTHLHHANSVATSLTFLNEGGLLSRGEVEKRDLFQTYQKSDFKDKRYNVWNDIFLDTHDLHGYFPRENKYGPVLFKFSTRFLLKTSYEVWVTKSNPMYWNRNMTRRDKYYSSVGELRRSWNGVNAQKRMITVRDVKRPILFKYLDQIILDDPQVLLNDVDIFRKAKRSLMKAMSENNCSAKLHRRKCRPYCFCDENYLAMHAILLEKLFHPRGSGF